MKTRMVCVVMMTFFALFASSIAEAMTAERVIENMTASYEREMRDIKDFTVITEGDAAFPAFTADRVITY